MTHEQIKDYLKKYRINSEEQLAKHIEELKRNTIPNNEIIFPLVDLLLNEKSVLNSFFAENKKQETIAPFFLDEAVISYQSFEDGKFKDNTVTYTSTRHKSKAGETHKQIVGDLEDAINNRLKLSKKINKESIEKYKSLFTKVDKKCSPQCFCDGSCKKPQEKNLGGYKIPNVKVNATRHKAREDGKFHKEIVGDLEGINRPPSTDDMNLVFVKEGTGYDYLKRMIKDDVITNSNRGEKETMEYLQSLKQKQEWVENRIKEDKKLIEEFGVKHNQLKPRLDVVINTQFPKALQLISLATEYGNSKYKETDLDMLNFKRVVGGSQTYFDSCARHSTDRNGLDESGLPHIIHAVWSSLAGLELWAEENKINVKEFTENYMKNLQD